MNMAVLKTGGVVLRTIRRADIARQHEYFRDEELAWLDSSSPEAYQDLDVENLLKPETDGIYELGINIGNRRYWNQGLGRQTIGLLLQHGFDQLGAREIQLTTNAKNDRVGQLRYAVLDPGDTDSSSLHLRSAGIARSQVSFQASSITA
jgi:RimJ/RimL family protein N-acetyltransferase